jgi:hypothetical protein
MPWPLCHFRLSFFSGVLALLAAARRFGRRQNSDRLRIFRNLRIEIVNIFVSNYLSFKSILPYFYFGLANY